MVRSPRSGAFQRAADKRRGCASHSFRPACSAPRGARRRGPAFFYYGSRPAQPARVRAFIEVTVELLADNPAFVLTTEELRGAENVGRAATKDLLG